MRNVIAALLSILFMFMEALGWFFVYAVIIYIVSRGAVIVNPAAAGVVCSWWLILAVLLASALSARALTGAILKWG